MQIVIVPDDFGPDGLPAGALARIVNDWAAALADVPAHEPTEPLPAVVPLPARLRSVEPEPPVAGPEEEPEPPVSGPEEKPKTKKRRTKAEIEAADDAACELELVNAATEGRDPSRENLPADTRRRVGRNPKSWIDPAKYAMIMASGTPAAKEEPEIVEIALSTTPAPPVGSAPVLLVDTTTGPDFSEFASAIEVDPHNEATLRFELRNKTAQLGALSRPAAGRIIDAWKAAHGTTAVPDLPAEALPGLIAEVEAALDAEQVE
jgi:hypothetical protein